MCQPIWWNDSRHDGRGGITCLSCVLARQECSFWRTDWNIELWPLVIQTAVGRALRQNYTTPDRDGDPGEGGSTGGRVQDQKICAVLPHPHLVAFEKLLQDPSQTALSLQTHQARLREIQRQEEHGAATLRALVENRRPIIDHLLRMFDQAIDSCDREAAGAGSNVEGKQRGKGRDDQDEEEAAGEQSTSG